MNFFDDATIAITHPIETRRVILSKRLRYQQHTLRTHLSHASLIMAVAGFEGQK
jgi:hypothetical protein